MPDPIIADRYRVTAIFQGDSGLPEDRFINSWVFHDPTVVNDVSGLGQCVFDFYDKIADGNTSSVWSTVIGGALLEDQLEVRVYDLGQAPPRVPEIFTYALAANTSNPLPEEICCCISWVASRNLPRQRGRSYIGPLRSGATAVTTGRVKVSDSVRALLANAGNGLRTGMGTAWKLHVLSGADGVTRDVTGGWVDDALDTQRRRGPDAAARTTFGTYTS